MRFDRIGERVNICTFDRPSFRSECPCPEKRDEWTARDRVSEKPYSLGRAVTNSLGFNAINVLVR
jgi:hypothetical protein